MSSSCIAEVPDVVLGLGKDIFRAAQIAIEGRPQYPDADQHQAELGQLGEPDDREEIRLQAFACRFDRRVVSLASVAFSVA